MLSESDIRDIFFLSDRPRKDALIADEVDIVQFAQNVARFVAAQEHQRCVDIARSYNSAVADLIKRHEPI